MMSRRACNFAIGLLLVLPTLAGLVGAGTTVDTPGGAPTVRQYLEPFTEYPVGWANPAGSTWQATTEAGTGTNNVYDAPAVSGLTGKYWQASNNGAAYTAQMRNTGAGVDLCGGAQSISFDVKFPDFAITETGEVRISTVAVSTAATPANTLGVRATGQSGNSQNIVVPFIRGNAGAVQVGSSVNVEAATVLHVVVSSVNCSGRASATINIAGTSHAMLAASGDPISGDLDRLTFGVTTFVSTSGATLLDNYDWQNAPLPAPTWTSISPTSGTVSGGTAVTITGTEFQPGATVSFDGTAATNVVRVSSTTITATTPAHAAGAVNVVVTNPDTQTATGTSAYTYTAVPNPTVTSVSPNSGTTQGGTVVTITGTGFLSTAPITVTFGGAAATNVVWVSSTTLTANTPAHAAGAVTVAVTNANGGSGSANSAYTYSTAPTPVIASLSPSSGLAAGGTVVNVTGQNFQAGFTATFDGIAAFSLQFVSGTLVRVTTPPHASGAVTFALTNPDGQQATATYTYSGTAGGVATDGSYQNVDDSLIADSGLGSDIAVLGDIIAIAHKTTGNVVVLTYSLDGGTTWVDKGTNGWTTAGSLFVHVSSATGFTIMTESPTKAGRRTVDGGNQWVATATTELGGTGSINCGPFDIGSFDSVGAVLYGTNVHTGANEAGGNSFCLSTGYIVKSTDGGATWTRHIDFVACGGDATQGLGSIGTTHVFGLDAVDDQTFHLYQAKTLSNTGTSPCGFAVPRYFRIVAGVTASNTVIEDSFSGTDAPLQALTASSQGDRHVAFKHDGSAGPANSVQIGIPVGDSNWLFKNAGTTTQTHLRISAEPGDGQGSARLVGSYTDSIVQWTAAYGETYQATVIQSGTPPANAQASIYMDCAASRVWVAGRNAADNSLATYALQGSAACPAGGAPIGAVGSVEFTSLLGFDVDGTGTSLISKDLEATEAVIEIYSGTNLEPGANEGQGCEHLYGVAALKDAVAYIDCGADGNGDVEAIKFRSPQLADPTLAPINCGASDFDLTDEEEVDVGSLEIEEIHGVPFDYSIHIPSAGSEEGDCNVIYGIAYTTETGKFGVLKVISQITYGDIQIETQQSNAIQIDSSTNPRVSQLTTCFDPATGATYIGATSPNGPTVIAKYTETSEGEPRLSPVFTNSGSLGRASSIACGQDMAVVVAQSGAYLINLTTRVAQGPFPADPFDHGAAMSLDGEWYSVYVGGKVEVRSVADPSNTTITLDAGEGTYRDTRLSSRGQSIWIGTTEEIVAYDITASTTVTPVAEFNTPYDQDQNVDGVPDYCEGALANTAQCTSAVADADSQGDGGGSLFVPDVSMVPPGFTLISFKALLGVMMVIGLAGVFYGIGHGSAMLGLVGVVFGVILATIMGLLDVWVIVTAVILAVAGIFLAIKLGR